MAWRSQRVSVYQVADIAARDALTGLISGDIAVVADADGSGNPATYIWSGTTWVEFLESDEVLAPLYLTGTSDVVQFRVTAFDPQTSHIAQFVNESGNEINIANNTGAGESPSIQFLTYGVGNVSLFLVDDERLGIGNYVAGGAHAYKDLNIRELSSNDVYATAPAGGSKISLLSSGPRILIDDLLSFPTAKAELFGGEEPQLSLWNDSAGERGTYRAIDLQLLTGTYKCLLQADAGANHFLRLDDGTATARADYGRAGVFLNSGGVVTNVEPNKITLDTSGLAGLLLKLGAAETLYVRNQGDTDYGDLNARAITASSWMAGQLRNAVRTTGTLDIAANKGSVALVTSAAQTITLPAPATAGTGWHVWIKEAAGSAATVVARNAAENIDGVASNVTLSAYEARHLVTDGTNWWSI